MLRLWSTALLLLVLAGCASTAAPDTGRYERAGPVADYPRGLSVEDSLRYANAALRDSLAFLDDIYSGQYFRDRRLLEQRIDELQYALATARDGGALVTTLQADELFEPASATLSAAGAAALDTLAVRLAREYPLAARFRIEGHADATPLGGSLAEQYPTNWELAAARAAAAVRQLAQHEGLAETRFEVASMGDTRPIASNQTATGRAQNRRLRVTVLP